jgi:hypothetical protein
MRLNLCALGFAALLVFPTAQAAAEAPGVGEEPQVDTRPDYNGPYRYPKEPAGGYPAFPYGAMPYGTVPCAYAPCGVAPAGNTYYEHNRDGTGYLGYGTPDGSGHAREHEWRTPRQLRREAN